MEASLWNYAIWTFDKILRTAEDWALDPAIIKRMHIIFLKTLKDPDRGQKIDLYWGHFQGCPEASNFGGAKNFFPDEKFFFPHKTNVF